jgi:hypothetical protein
MCLCPPALVPSCPPCACALLHFRPSIKLFACSRREAAVSVAGSQAHWMHSLGLLQADPSCILLWVPLLQASLLHSAVGSITGACAAAHQLAVACQLCNVLVQGQTLLSSTSLQTAPHKQTTATGITSTASPPSTQIPHKQAWGHCMQKQSQTSSSWRCVVGWCCYFDCTTQVGAGASQTMQSVCFVPPHLAECH